MFSIKKEKYIDIVGKCYSELLHRNPDSVGLKHYLDLFENRNFDKKKLMKDMANSVECQVIKIKSEVKIEKDSKENFDLIRKCYRELLFRKPDKEGIVHYLHLLDTGQFNEETLIRDIKNSMEYKAKYATINKMSS